MSTEGEFYVFTPVYYGLKFVGQYSSQEEAKSELTKQDRQVDADEAAQPFLGAYANNQAAAKAIVEARTASVEF